MVRKRLSILIVLIIGSFLGAMIVFLRVPQSSTRVVNKISVSTTVPVYSLANSTPSGSASFVGPVQRTLVDNSFIGYRIFGSGQDLVLIAGQDATMSYWGTQLLADLSRHYRVIMLDNPGVGYSTYAGPQPMTIESLAQIIGDFLTVLDVKKATVLGWGMGGEIALVIAIRFPEVLSRLVLVGSSAGGASAVAPAENVSSIMGSSSSTLKQRIDLMFLPETNQTIIGSYISDIELLGDLEITNQAIAEQAQAQKMYLSDNFVVSNLGNITIPVLIMDGSQDLLFPVQNANNLAASLIYTTKIIRVSTGYYLPIDEEPYFISILESFTG